MHLAGLVAVVGAGTGAAEAGLVRPAVPVSTGDAVLTDLGGPPPVNDAAVETTTTATDPPAPPQTTPPPTAVTTTTTTATTTGQRVPEPVAPPVVAEPPPPPSSPLARVEETYRSSVPAAWRSAIPAQFSVIPGSTSWASADGRIEISRFHAEASAAHLAVIVTHEFGHLIAFRHGSGAYAGAAPAGWPAATANPAEHWADCVQQVFTRRVSPSPGLPPCGGEQLAFADRYLAAGPPA